MFAPLALIVLSSMSHTGTDKYCSGDTVRFGNLTNAAHFNQEQLIVPAHRQQGLFGSRFPDRGIEEQGQTPVEASVDLHTFSAGWPVRVGHGTK
jgi:hypothetical protein